MNNEIADYLKRLKQIYVAVDEKLFRNDIVALEKIIDSIQEKPRETISNPKTQKKTFSDSYHSVIQKNYQDLRGTKLNYEKFTTEDDVVCYFEQNVKTKILKNTTALDLKLLYSLLTGNPIEIKGNKNDLYEIIKRNVRARKRGEAFMKSV
jgi:hypothetical protein